LPYRGVKGTQNAGFTVKLNQEIPFHLFCDWHVPAEHFDTASSLPYPCPFVSNAQDFGHANRERWGTIPFSERFEQEELLKEVAAERRQRELCFRMNPLAADSHHRFYRTSERLPEFFDTINRHRQADCLSVSSKTKKQFLKRPESLDQVDTRDASS